MKRMRNVLMLLLVLCSTVLFSACSCGKKDTTVYAESITLACQNTNNYTYTEVDGVMYIDVFKGETFTVEYTIAPVKVTNTQVDLNIDAAGKQAIRPLTGSYVYTGLKNAVTFTAFEMGEATITFDVHLIKGGNKITATCVVKVSQAKNTIESLSTPTNLNYSLVNHTLYWDKVTTTVDNMGNETSIMHDGVAVGLDGYDVKIQLIDGSERVERVKDNSYSNFDLGTTYTVSVMAVGDVYHASNSENYSRKFTFCQLETVENMVINDGVVTWDAVAGANEYEVYTAEGKSTTVYNTTYTLTDVMDEYNIYIVAYAEGGADNPTDDFVSPGSSGIRYYHSVANATQKVIQIKDLEWTLNNSTTANQEVAGVGFNNVTGSSVLSWKFKDNTTYTSDYGVGFMINIYECDEFGVIPTDSTPVLTTQKVADTEVSFGDFTSRGYYKVQVQALGNSNNTLKPMLMETDPIYITPKMVDTEVTILDNQIKYTRTSGVEYSEIEYYFIETTDNTKNYFTKTPLDALNLSNIGLQSGTYDVYAKIIGSTNSVSTNSTVSDKLVSFTILGAVANSYMLRSSDIYFTPIENADSYRLNLIKVQGEDETTLSINQTIVPTVEGGLVKFNLYNVLKAHLDSTTQESVDAYLTHGEYKYSIISVSDDSDILNSGYSIPKSFYRQAGIKSATLTDGVVAWEYDTVYTENTEIGIVLNGTTLTSNFRNETTLDTNTNSEAKALLSNTSVNEFKFTVLGADGNVNEPCVLDSSFDIVSIGVTQVASNLVVDSDALQWTIADSDADNYDIKIYKYVNGTNDVLLDTIEDNPSTSIALTNVAGRIKTVNDNASDENKLESKVLYVTVTQTNAGKFTNVESGKYYFYYFSSPTLNLNYKASTQEYVLEWNQVTAVDVSHSSYTLDVLYRESDGDTPVKDETLSKNAIHNSTTSSSIGTVSVNTFNAGIYDATLQVVLSDAYYGNDYTNGISKPYYLFASSDETSFTVVDGASSTLAFSDKTLVWDGVPNVGHYTLKYCITGSVGGSYSVLADNLTGTSYNNFGALSANNYDFELTINPDYDYNVNQDGIDTIIINNIRSISNITKLGTVTDAGTENGVFYFNTLSLSQTYNYTIYYNNVKLDEDEYEVIDTRSNATNYTYFVKFNFDINDEAIFTFKVDSPTTIDGAVSQTFTVNPIVANKLENLIRVDGNGVSRHYLVWEDDGSPVTKFIINRLSPTKTITLYTTDAGTDLDDATKGFYRVDGKYYYLFDDTDPDVKIVGSYVYTVQAETETNGYLNSKVSNQAIVNKLDNVISMEVVDGKLNITKPEAEHMSSTFEVTITHYTVNADTQEKEYSSVYTRTLPLNTNSDHTIDFASYDELSMAGQYEIKVQFVGGYIALDDLSKASVYFITSEYSTPKYVKKAQAPHVYMINGGISWNNSIGSVGTTIYYNVNITSDNDAVGKTITTTETTLTATMLEANGIVFGLNETYYVKVGANTSEYINSEASETYSVKQLDSVTDFKIDIEVGSSTIGADGEVIPLGTKVLKWTNPNDMYRLDPNGAYVYIDGAYVDYDSENDEHEGISRYSYKSTNCIIYYVDSSTGSVVDKQIITDTRFVLAQAINTGLVTGTYKCYIELVGSTDLKPEQGSEIDDYVTTGYLSSNKSNVVTLNIIEETTSVSIADNQVKWDSVNGAYAYRVEFDYIGTGSGPVEGFSVYTTDNKVDLSSTDINTDNVYGAYKISIYAHTDCTSDEAFIITTNTAEANAYNTKNSVSLFKVDEVTDYKILDGMFSWTVSLETLKNYLVDNTIDINTIASAGSFDAGLSLSDMVAYLNHLNLIRAVRYIGGIINDNASADDNISKALSPFINYQLDVNGVKLNVVPMKVEALNDSGEAVELDPKQYLGANPADDMDLGNIKLRYYYDLVKGYETLKSQESQGGQTVVLNLTTGFYNVSVASYGNSTLPVAPNTAIIGSNSTDSLKVYKPSTPISATSNSQYSDIRNSDLFWNLVTTDTTTVAQAKYFSNYRIEAMPRVNTGEEDGAEDVVMKSAYQDISFGDENDMIITNTQNATNFHIKNANLSSMFSTDILDVDAHNYIVANEAYDIKLYVKGTADSDLVDPLTEYYYINGSSMSVNTYMCMLDRPTDFRISGGVISWTNSEYSTKVNLRIYGPYNLYYNYTDKKPAEYSSSNWYVPASEYLGGYAELPQGIESYDIEIITNGANAQNTYVLDERFAVGGYSISVQAMGNGLGVVDSNLTDENTSLYAVKLDSTNVGVKSGNFVWPTVQDATSYYVQVYGKPKDSEPAYDDNGDLIDDSVYLTGFNYANPTITTIATKPHVVYDLDDSISDPDMNYYIKVSPRNYSTAGTIAYLYGDYTTSNAYGRLVAPTIDYIDADGNIAWNADEININHIDRFVLYSNYTDVEDGSTVLEKTECGSGVQATLLENDEYATQAFTVQVRVMSIVDTMLNSARSQAINLVKMEKPDLRVEGGDIVWDNAPENLGSEITDSHLEVSYKVIEDVEGTPTENTIYLYRDTVSATAEQKYSLYNGVDDTENLLPVTTYTAQVNYIGTTIESGEEVDYDKYYYLSSNPSTLSLMKLDTVTISNYNEVDEATTEVTSYIRWNTNEFTEHYNVYIKATYNHNGEGQMVATYNSINLQSYFSTKTLNGADCTLFNMDMALNDGGQLSQVATYDNLKLHVYVQSLGTVNSAEVSDGDTLYVSSNFSNVLIIEVPPTPSELQYVAEKGSITWVSVPESGYDIEGVITYTFDTDENLLNNYWLPTANTTKLGEEDIVTNGTVDTVSRQSEVTLRHVNYEYKGETDGVKYYKLTVIDNIKLEPVDGITQQEYYLNQVSDNYELGYTVKLRASVHSEDGVGVEGKYKSAWTDELDIVTVGFFVGGDGTEKNPYTITTAEQLAFIDIYPSRHFKLLNDITTGWTVKFALEEQAFTGSFDGDGNTIYINALTPCVGESGIVPILGFIGYNKGIIKNLEVSYSNLDIADYMIDMVGGISAYNYGEITQCQVAGGLKVKRSVADQSTIVLGGIAGYNASGAEISYCANTATMSASSITANPSEIGGIVGRNYGYIDYSGMMEKSSIVGNYVGGVAVYNYSGAEITECFSKGTLESIDTNGTNMYASVQLGGIVANNQGTISYSYSIAVLKLNRNLSNSAVYYVGGLIGYNANTTDCIENYVVFRLYNDNINPDNGNEIVTSSWFSKTGSQNIGVVIGRSNVPTTKPQGITGWSVFYAVEDSILGLIQYELKDQDGDSQYIAVGKYNNTSRKVSELLSMNINIMSSSGSVSGANLPSTRYSWYNYMNEGATIDSNGDKVTYHYPILSIEFNLLFTKNQYYDVVTLDFSGVYYIDSNTNRVELPNNNNNTFVTDGTYVYYVVINYTISHTGKEDVEGVVSSAGTVYYEVSANSYNSASELGEYKVKIYLDGDLITFADMPTNENMTYGEDAKGQYVEYTWYLVSA